MSAVKGLQALRRSLKALTALKAPGVAVLFAAGLLAAAPRPAPPPPSPTAQASKQVQDAQAQLAAAQANYKKARTRVESSFKGRPDWAKAQQDVDKAKTDVAVAQQAVQTALDKRADYKAAKESVAVLTDKQAKALQEGKATPDEMAQIGQQLVEQRAAVKSMEVAAFEADPKYTEAKTRLTAAQQVQSGLQTQVDQAAAADPECVAAQQQVDSATQQVASARQNLEQVRKSEAEARAAAAKAKAGSTSAPPRGIGGGRY
jgi:chromosome segregation ATPase